MRGEEVGRSKKVKKSKILNWSDFGRRCQGGCRGVRQNKSGREIRPGRSPSGRFRALCCRERGSTRPQQQSANERPYSTAFWYRRVQLVAKNMNGAGISVPRATCDERELATRTALLKLGRERGSTNVAEESGRRARSRALRVAGVPYAC